MTQLTTKSARALIAEALDGLPSITAREALALVADDQHIFVDLSDQSEKIKTCIISGAVSSSLGMLEFHLDPESPLHKAELG